MSNKDNTSVEDAREITLRTIERLSDIWLQKEFFEWLKFLPSYIGKEELELYLFILREYSKSNDDIFNTQREIYDKIYALYYKDHKRSDPNYPIYMKNKDKKHFIGKKPPGIINKLMDAKLIIEVSIQNRSSEKEQIRRVKRTWKYRSLKINLPNFQYYDVYDAPWDWSKMRYSDGTKPIFKRDVDDMIKSLESYLFNKEVTYNVRLRIEKYLADLPIDAQNQFLARLLDNIFIRIGLMTPWMLSRYTGRLNSEQSEMTVDRMLRNQIKNIRGTDKYEHEKK